MKTVRHTLMLLGANGPSRVVDHVWAERFAYAELLSLLGASVQVVGNVVNIDPSRPNKAGLTLDATDTRAAAVAILAALGISGQTCIRGAHHLDRGYEHFVEKLQAVGAHIVRGP